MQEDVTLTRAFRITVAVFSAMPLTASSWILEAVLTLVVAPLPLGCGRRRHSAQEMRNFNMHNITH